MPGGFQIVRLQYFDSSTFRLYDEAVMSLSLDDVKKVAKLGRLDLSAEALTKAQSQLTAIFDYIDQLKALPTDGVEPLAHPLPVHNVFRDDVPGTCLTPDEALANAPVRYGDFFGVPAVFETDGPVSH
jgi:aspartyl-tRNA(Asn)/glutamyl-tRNA(Gln) amidotransferase subunit C